MLSKNKKIFSILPLPKIVFPTVAKEDVNYVQVTYFGFFVDFLFRPFLDDHYEQERTYKVSNSLTSDETSNRR